MLDFLWDLHQSSRINSAESRLSSAEQRLTQIRSVEERLRVAEERIEKLVLVNQALLELLCAKRQVTEAEVLDKVIEIDLRDGVQDGRLGSPTTCGQCGRTLNQRRTKCLFCGEVQARNNFVDQIGE